MSKFSNLFMKDFIFLNSDYESRDVLLEKVYIRLLRKGRVKRSFINAIKEREALYPTGLPVTPFGVAIPHTDPEHVNEPCIAIIKPKNPVVFKEMGQGENDIECKFIFMLVVKNNGEQVELLQELISIFTNEENMHKLDACKNENEILELITNLI